MFEDIPAPYDNLKKSLEATWNNLIWLYDNAPDEETKTRISKTIDCFSWYHKQQAEDMRGLVYDVNSLELELLDDMKSEPTEEVKELITKIYSRIRQYYDVIKVRVL